MILTLVTPSPGGEPIPITRQSQTITSFVPQFTLCELPPVAEVLVTPIPTTTTAPYKNYTVSIPSGSGTCTTIFSPTISTVCATVLTGLANKYTVTKCDQEITFSSNYGYVLVTASPTVTTIMPLLESRELFPERIILANGTGLPNGTPPPSNETGPLLNETAPAFNETSPALNGTTPLLNGTAPTLSQPSTRASPLVSTITPPPTIQTLTTYFIAPWQQLTSAGPPSNVDLKVCTTYANGTRKCVLESFEWITTLATQTATTTTAINLTTTIAGPSQLVVETFIANITDMITTFSLQTSMVLEYETLIEATSTATRSLAVPSSVPPTVYETYTVLPAS